MPLKEWGTLSGLPLLVPLKSLPTYRLSSMPVIGDEKALSGVLAGPFSVTETFMRPAGVIPAHEN